MVIGQADVRKRELRVERERLLETLPAPPRGLRRELPLIRPVAKIRLVGRHARHPAFRRRVELQLQGVGNRRRNLVLDGEDVGHLAVVALRPQVRAVGSQNELRRHTDAAAGAADAALEDVRHAERVRDPADVLVLAFERKRRRARNHLEAGHLRERVDDLVREAVAEILVVRIPAHVGERQHGDGGCDMRWFELVAIAAAAGPS